MTNKNKQDWKERLQRKYRLSVMDDESMEQVFLFRLTRMNIYVVASTIFVVLVALILALIVLTPLKEYIPGYGDVGMRRQIVDMSYKTDSLQKRLIHQSQFIDNIQRIVRDEVDTSSRDNGVIDEEKDYSNIDLDKTSKEDSLLRAEIEDLNNYALFGTNSSSGSEGLEDLYFFPPVDDGQISDGFDPQKEHYGLDITAPEADAPIKSVADGVVIIADWSVETGHTIGIQHRNNLISFYKHNSDLLKKVGNFVRAGDVIALMGNSGEQTTGPHLHLELWYNQAPIDPSELIKIN